MLNNLRRIQLHYIAARSATNINEHKLVNLSARTFTSKQDDDQKATKAVESPQTSSKAEPAQASAAAAKSGKARGNKAGGFKKSFLVTKANQPEPAEKEPMTAADKQSMKPWERDKLKKERAQQRTTDRATQRELDTVRTLQKVQEQSKFDRDIVQLKQTRVNTFYRLMEKHEKSNEHTAMRFPQLNSEIWDRHFKSQEQERLDREAEQQAAIELKMREEQEAKEAEQDQVETSLFQKNQTQEEKQDPKEKDSELEDLEVPEMPYDRTVDAKVPEMPAIESLPLEVQQEHARQQKALGDALDLIRKRIRRTLRDRQNKQSGFQSQHDENTSYATDRLAHLRSSKPLPLALEKERSELVARLNKGEVVKPSPELQMHLDAAQPLSDEQKVAQKHARLIEVFSDIRKQEDMIEINATKSDEFKKTYLNLVHQGKSHNEALQGTFSKMKTEKYLAKPIELPSRKELITDSKVDSTAYPVSKTLFDREQKKEEVEPKQEDSMSEAQYEKVIETFNSKFEPLFAQIQDEVITEWYKENLMVHAKKIDEIANAKLPIHLQINMLTTEDFIIDGKQTLLKQNLPDNLISVVQNAKEGMNKNHLLAQAKKLRRDSAQVKKQTPEKILEGLKATLIAQLPAELQLSEQQMAEHMQSADMTQKYVKEQYKESLSSQSYDTEFSKELEETLEQICAIPTESELSDTDPETEAREAEEYEREMENRPPLAENEVDEMMLFDELALLNEEMSLAQPEIQQKVYDKFTPLALQHLKEAGLNAEELRNVEQSLEIQAGFIQEADLEDTEQTKHLTVDQRLEIQNQSMAAEQETNILAQELEVLLEQLIAGEQMNFVNGEDPKQVAFIQALSRIVDAKKLTKQDLDDIVETLRFADPETPQIQYIGHAGSPVKHNSAQVQQQAALKAVQQDLHDFNQKAYQSQTPPQPKKTISAEHQQAIDKLGIAKKPRWMALVHDVQLNTANEQGVSACLTHFYSLLHGLQQKEVDSQKMVQHVLSLAKYNNKYNVVDKYMRNFCKVLIQEQPNSIVTKNLEILLNTEVAVMKEQAATYESVMNPPVHHNLLAQAEFPFMSAGGKLHKIDKYKEDLRQLEVTRQMREQLTSASVQEQHELITKFEPINEMLAKIDVKNADDVATLPVFKRLNTTASMTNQLIESSFQDDYGIKGINYDNLEQVYNPHYTGIATLAETRDHLISNGMSDSLADMLMQRYLKKIQETCSVHSLLDFFSRSEAKGDLIRAKPDEIFTNYVNMHSIRKTQKLQANKLSQSSRMTPIKPTFMALQARMFSNQMFADVRASGVDEKQAKARSKFIEFVESVEAIDEEVKQSEMGFDDSNLDIGFQGGEPDGGRSAAAMIFSDEEQESPFAQLSESQRLKNEHDELVRRAKEKYDTNFFLKFAYSGRNGAQLTQKALEEHISREEDIENLRMLCLSIINSAYELNKAIPNIEMMFYKIFFSPITTKEMRKKLGDSDYLLDGSLFAREGINLGPMVYRSLLETIALYPKKKHYKKVTQHLIHYEDKENVTGDLMRILIQVGIDQEYPILLGQNMKYFLQSDYQIPKRVFKDFVLFLERSKGFEEDAKRFIVMTGDTTHIQMDYELLRPFFKRQIQYATGQEVLKLFEQFRKNLKLNNQWKNADSAEKAAALKEIKCGVYDGLIDDLLHVKAYQLAQIVYNEKLKERYDATMKDQLVGMQILSVQTMLPEFQAKFKEVFLQNTTGATIDQSVCEEMARMLQYFQSQDTQDARMEMMEQIYSKLVNEQIFMSSKLFDSLMFVYTESQQWMQILQLLNWVRKDNCAPEMHTINYLKKNLLYCFEATIRAQVKDRLEQFEQEFFLGQYKAGNQDQQAKQPQKQQN